MARPIVRYAHCGGNIDFVEIFPASGDQFLNMERALKAQALSYTDMTGNGGLIGRFQQAQPVMMDRAYADQHPRSADLFQNALFRPPAAPTRGVSVSLDVIGEHVLRRCR